jgi:MFS family permease
VWGVTLACHAATHNFIGLLVVRFFLGAAESGVSPGFGLITGMWYRVEEQPLRCGIWFTGNSIAVMIGGLLAYGIAHIQNSLDTWKWLFLIYAILTLVFAVLLGLFLPDKPQTAKFLTEAERQGAIERIKANQTGTVNNAISWYQVREALTDYKIWLLFFTQLANQTPNGAILTVGRKDVHHSVQGLTFLSVWQPSHQGFRLHNPADLSRWHASGSHAWDLCHCKHVPGWQVSQGSLHHCRCLLSDLAHWLCDHLRYRK